MELLIDVLQFALPAWIINSALNLLYPLKVRSQFFASLDAPLDFGTSFFGNRLFGDSTTVLGLATALGMGLLIEFLFPHIPGLYIGLGMYLGHLLASFLKRRLFIEPGRFIPLLNHGDGIVVTGAILFLTGFLTDIKVFLITLALTYAIYPVLCFVAYKLNLRKNPL